MKPRVPLTFKLASEDWEFTQIYNLNYRTFVEEIPQHSPNPDQLLVDKFDQENTYLICLRDKKLLGMVAVRDKRPFSLDLKIANLESYLPTGRSMCEIRLLAVEKESRNGRIFRGLLNLLLQHCQTQNYNLAVISGAVSQQKLYRHLGFVPFGPLVGTSEAPYQPMYLTLEGFAEKSRSFAKLLSGDSTEHLLEDTINQLPGDSSAHLPEESISQKPFNFLPGPVGIRQQVREAFIRMPVSHRSDNFIATFQKAKGLLTRLTGAQHVEILLGSGTLANDVVAAQLSLYPKQGLILSNGEFGQRIIDQANRFGLQFQVLRFSWGSPFDYNTVQNFLKENPAIHWLWAVHSETSTGILNNLQLLKQICRESNIQLVLDCISSIGLVPLDLAGVYLATGVSGKALGAYPGLSMVFYNHELPAETKGLPRYLDLGFYVQQEGIPFTHSSNLIQALIAALEHFSSPEPFAETAALTSWLRARLQEAGLPVLADAAHGTPGIFTLPLPRELNSAVVGQRLEEAGYLLSYKSGYLLEQNWIQICLMGECSREMLAPLLNLLNDCCTFAKV